MNNLSLIQLQGRTLVVACQPPGQDRGAGQPRGEVRDRRGQHLGCGSALSHPAVLQDDDVLGQGGDVQDVMGDQQDRQPLLRGPARHQAPHLPACGDVQGRHRLVEDQQARARRQGPGERHASRLPARELGAPTSGEVLNSGRLQFGIGALAGGAFGDMAAARPEGDIVQHTHVGEDPRGLGQQGDVATTGGHEAARAVQLPLAQEHPAAIGVEQARHDPADGRLARAVGADECERASGPDLQVRGDIPLGGCEGDAQIQAAGRGGGGAGGRRRVRR